MVYHGKVGSGLSVKHGPVALLSVVEDRERGFMLLIAQGESVPGVQPGSAWVAETWNSYGPAHHCAIGVAHGASQLHKVANLLGLRSVQIC